MSGVLPIQAMQADEIRTIALRHGVERVRVFGSVARGEARPESDVDLLIRLQPGRGFSDLMAFCREVEAAIALVKLLEEGGKSAAAGGLREQELQRQRT